MILHCAKCGKDIPQSKNRFCSLSCVVYCQHKLRRDPQWQGFKLETECFNCGIAVVPYKKKFCSNSCAASLVNKLRSPRSAESRKKTSESVKRRNLEKKLGIPKPSIIKKIPKKKHKIYHKVCIVCGKSFSVRRNTKCCSRECLSLRFHELSINSIDTGWGHAGRYKGIICQSTYELAFVIYMLDHGKKIERCPLRIPYLLKEKKHFYNPDFIIEGKIFEIKGRISEKDKAKFKAAKSQNIKLCIVARRSMQKYINYVNKKYKVKLSVDHHKFYDK